MAQEDGPIITTATHELFQRKVYVDEIVREIGRNSIWMREEYDFLCWMDYRASEIARDLRRDTDTIE